MAHDLDLRLLKAFATLVKAGSHARAAEVLNVTQSAISHAMRRLEEQLGCVLFYKKGKTTHLSPEGRIFLSQVLRILDDVDRAAESVSGRFSDSRGKLTVIFSTSMAHLILAPVLREFRECYPNISLVVRLEDSLRAVQALEEGDCDVAVAVEDQLPPSLKGHALFQDNLEFVFSPMHPWAERTRIAAADMSKEHFLLYQRNSISFRRTEEFFLRSGVRLASYVEIPSFEIMKQIAALGFGVAIMAPWAAAREIADGSLLTRPLPKFPVRRKWSAIHQAAREIRQPEQTFIGLCRMASASALARIGQIA